MQRRIKWLLDRLLALLLLVALAPLLLAIALLVLVTSGAPVLHREPRLGLAGHTFTLRKFRSLRSAAGPGIAADDDARLTRVGRLLRRWRLDELAGLANVLTGDMSLVGPRPLSPRHADALPDTQLSALLSVRPGVTGVSALAFMADDEVLAGRPDPEALYLARILPAKAALEQDYLAHWSLGLDLQLLGRTLLETWSPRARRRSRERVSRLLAGQELAP